MIVNIYNFICELFHAIGFDSLLLELFPYNELISSMTSYDFIFVLACVILSFLCLYFLLRLFVGILRKFVEVICND